MTDWKQVFIAYMDYIYNEDGADYLWPNDPYGLSHFISRLPEEARDEVREIIRVTRKKRFET